MPRPSTPIFSVEEESSAGGTGYSWVEKTNQGYCLFTVEEGLIAGPYPTVYEAVTGGGQFGMDYTDIECSIPEDEFRRILESGMFILENYARITINGVESEAATVQDILAAYRKSKAK